MLFSRHLATGVGLCLAAGALFAANTGARPGQVAWLNDIEAAKRASKESGKPLFLVYR